MDKRAQSIHLLLWYFLKYEKMDVMELGVLHSCLGWPNGVVNNILVILLTNKLLSNK